MSKIFMPYEDFINSFGTPVNMFQDVNSILGDVNFQTVFGINDTDIEVYYNALYSDRPIAFPVSYDYLDTGDIKIFGKMKKLVDFVVKTNKPKYLAALNMVNSEYNPIENYNMTEKEASGLKIDKNKTKTGTDDGYKTITGVRGSKVTETQVAPYDSSAYNNQSKVIEKYEGDANPGSTTSVEGHLTSESDPTNTKGTSLGADHSVGNDNNTVNDRVLTRTGNIGVTTTQQMWQQELELKKLNILEEFYHDINEKVLLACY